MFQHKWPTIFFTLLFLCLCRLLVLPLLAVLLPPAGVPSVSLAAGPPQKRKARLPDLHPAACACSVCMHCMPALCACAACVHCVLGAARSQIGCSSQMMSSTRALWLHGFVLFCRASRSPLLFFAGCCCLFPALLSGGWLAAQCLTQTSSHQAAALEVALRQDRRPQAAQYVART